MRALLPAVAALLTAAAPAVAQVGRTVTAGPLIATVRADPGNVVSEGSRG
jgi:hypothetical protein